MILAKNKALSGTTLVEASISACTAALFLGSLFTMNMTGMKAIRTAREATSASQVLQQRVESMRIANWHQITNADWVTNNLLGSNAAGSESLKQTTETLTITPYDSTSTATTEIVRTGGAARVVTRNASLLNEHAVKVVWTLAYSGGLNARSTTRQTVAILAKGGVAKW
jgi:hypothetical protein